MYYYKQQSEAGDYVDDEGVRYELYRGATVGNPKLTTWFDTREECLEAWSLTYDPLPDPESER